VTLVFGLSMQGKKSKKYVGKGWGGGDWRSLVLRLKKRKQ
jgi:hypothetical protein